MDLLEMVRKTVDEVSQEEREELLMLREMQRNNPTIEPLDWLLLKPETLSPDLVDKTILHFEGVKGKCNGNAHYEELMHYLEELKDFRASGKKVRKSKKKNKSAPK